MSAGVCSPYVGGSGAWIETAASGMTKCYGFLGSPSNLQLRASCNHDCNYAGCAHESSSYCPTQASMIGIRNAAENAVVADLINLVDAAPTGAAAVLANEGFHIARLGRRDSATWEFIDTATYTNWAPGHPTSGTDCMVIKADGLWYSTNCGLHRALCMCHIVVSDWPPPAPFPPRPPPSRGPPRPSPPPAPALPPAPPGAPIGIIVVAIAAVLVLAVAVLGYLLIKKKQAAQKLRAQQQAAAAEAKRKEALAEEMKPVSVGNPDGSTAIGLKQVGSNA